VAAAHVLTVVRVMVGAVVNRGTSCLHNFGKAALQVVDPLGQVSNLVPEVFTTTPVPLGSKALLVALALGHQLGNLALETTRTVAVATALVTSVRLLALSDPIMLLLEALELRLQVVNPLLKLSTTLGIGLGGELLAEAIETALDALHLALKLAQTTGAMTLGMTAIMAAMELPVLAKKTSGFLW